MSRRMRRCAFLAAGALIAAGSGGAGSAAEPSAGPVVGLGEGTGTGLGTGSGANIGVGQHLRTLTRILDAWTAYKGRHLDPSGRIVDSANQNISHSEGQGYGMLIAVKLGDREAFDAIWTWTLANLGGQRPDHLFAWKWAPNAAPHVTDTNNATDGDVLIAWALVEAAALWEEPAYLDTARAIVRDIAARAVIDTRFGKVFLPGEKGFTAAEREDGPVVNLSYWIFPARTALETAAPDFGWAGVFDTGRSILAASDAGPLSLPPEWTSLKGETPAPAAEFDAVFGYNAIRIPLYVAWGGGDAALLRRFRGLWNAQADVGPFVIDIATGAALDPLVESGFRAVSSLVECALAPADGGRHAVRLGGSRQNYYPETLNLLSAIAQMERYPSCLS